MPESSTTALSIVTPTLWEAQNIPDLAVAISSAVSPEIPDWEWIIVDDDSRDGTLEICGDLQREGYPLHLIIRRKQRDLSLAVVEGLEYAQGAVYVVMDGDLSHPAGMIPVFYGAVKQGADFVIGSRYLPGGSTDDRWTVYRYINSKTATLLSLPLASITDPMSGFFALSPPFWDRCKGLSPVGYKIGLELIVKGQPSRLEEVPISFRTRSRGKSKLTLRQQLLFLRHLYLLYAYIWRRKRKGGGWRRVKAILPGKQQF